MELFLYFLKKVFLIFLEMELSKELTKELEKENTKSFLHISGNGSF